MLAVFTSVYVEMSAGWDSNIFGVGAVETVHPLFRCLDSFVHTFTSLNVHLPFSKTLFLRVAVLALSLYLFFNPLAIDLLEFIRIAF